MRRKKKSLFYHLLFLFRKTGIIMSPKDCRNCSGCLRRLEIVIYNDKMQKIRKYSFERVHYKDMRIGERKKIITRYAYR